LSNYAFIIFAQCQSSPINGEIVLRAAVCHLKISFYRIIKKQAVCAFNFEFSITSNIKIMKAKIIGSICLALSVTLAVPHLFAQNASNKNALVYQSSTENSVSVKSAAAVTVNEKTLKSFNKKFSENDAKWFKAGHGYIAIFSII
jgi:hypothetical protein